ncbi:pyridoxine 5'-phosphate synthase [Geoalkalibacter halelectricus]|uniref:Pyridoxine 5'-phosphate synthase n=1 Tax=Geoalkalibacter halelectricus TaxID=2847045 RepID=A0ABY5ZSF2_9BACT|nr:pyridoxine 5'-phosphate synthase [Geoalkalibacter halelectricus]UWZ81611.1 pyridoxine 5'-phosphate synthase [Geoalkalibacter halelectricus]
MPRLGVNVDHVATVRQARRTSEPDPVTAAALAELAGASVITVHLREDRRHIQDRDVEVLRRTIQTRLNLEMAATDEMFEIALRIRPDCVTLVPEKRQELTTEGGLDVVRQRQTLQEPMRRLREAGIFVSLFADPDLAQIEAALELHSDAVEIHTGIYCDARTEQSRRSELVKIEQAVRLGQQLGLAVHAGHGLNYQNIRPLVALGGIEEFNIGHSIVSRAVLVGMERAVREMLALIEGR